MFFFQAEDGIRDYKVTGVQTCALPILTHADRLHEDALEPERLEQIGHLLRRGCEATVCAAGRHRTDEHVRVEAGGLHPDEIGRARVGKECRSRWSPYH